MMDAPLPRSVPGGTGLHEVADLWRARNPFTHLPADHSHLRNHAIEAYIASNAA